LSPIALTTQEEIMAQETKVKIEISAVIKGKQNLCGKDGKCKGMGNAHRALCLFSLDENGNADGCAFLAYDFETCTSKFAHVFSLLAVAQTETEVQAA
jgi:hypothetical protein